MSVKILMNNKNKFKVDGTVEDWVQKIKNEQLLEISPTIFIVSENVSEVYEILEKDNTKKKSRK
ncbi:MAG: hypothetical protein H7Y18_14805 [Clostridiaceae bacterium]|nr:hypothetical protein [Clostridiaceae bacterium]